MTATSHRSAPSRDGSSPRTVRRREEARTAAAALRAEQERAARRARTVVVVVLIASVLLLGGVMAAILAQEGRSPLDTVATAPVGATASGAIPVGASGVAGSTEGSDPDAVVVSVYADYLCPFCALFEETNAGVLDELRGAGDVVVEYHPVSILDRLSAGTDYSTRAATAAALVADRAPAAFVAFNTAMYAQQPEESTPGLTDAEIADVARAAGVEEEVAALVADGSYLDGAGSFRPWVAAATEQASADLPRLATPAILLDGEVLDTEEYDWTQPGRLAAAIEAARG